MRLFPLALIVLLSWGALAIGGSPSWAGAPTLVFAIATGLIGVIEGRRRPGHRTMALALLLVVAAVMVQATPLPAGVVSRVSPHRGNGEFERSLAVADRRDPEFVPQLQPDDPRPLSIAPSRTLIGLGVVIGFAILLLGATYGLAAVGAAAIVPFIVALGVVVAFLGMYQMANQSSALYGWYVPTRGATDSAPFVNKNHQAGWLVPVLSLTIGAFAGELARRGRTAAQSWRDRILWLSSTQGNAALLFIFSAAAMAIAVLLTQSRSGAAILVLALAVFASWTRHMRTSSVRRWTVFGGVVVVGVLAALVAGEGVANRIAGTDWASPNSRIAAWLDSFNILREFWATGTGFNTYGVAMLRYQTANTYINFIEAHNDYLQLAVEGGLLVGIPALLLIVVIAREVRSRFHEGADDTRTYWLRVGAVAGIAAMAAQAIVEFTLQMPGAAVMFVTLLAIAVHHPRPREVRGSRHA